jgi:hypothetical protein
MGVARKPEIRPGEGTARIENLEQIHLILEGSPYERGLKSGELTKDLLLLQEDSLVGKLREWIPRDWMLQALVLGASLWFHGAEDYIDPEYLQEMYGISRSAPEKYDFLADGYTRQIAYHGLHEVGQMMVDQGGENMGCTVLAAQAGKNWIVGRNFDFEGGRVFDEKKIIKWVFPDRGHPFVSVIWAGMVGVVTGVNSKGVYGSLNAAGSEDFRRVATPSTLVLLKIMQEASTVWEAANIIKNSEMFITDIFVLADRNGNLLRVEKSPTKTAIVKLEGPSVVTNHLIAPEFAGDTTNKMRIEELTTEARFERGQKLVAGLKGLGTEQAPEIVRKILDGLRDKGADEHGQPLTLGNRLAIDALIATHSVIYDSLSGILYVSTGPAVSGAFTGWDLAQSFAYRRPVPAGMLPAEFPPEIFYAHQALIDELHRVRGLVKRRECGGAVDILEHMNERYREIAPYYSTLGDAYKCAFQPEKARAAWKKALELHPAYAHEHRELERRLKE